MIAASLFSGIGAPEVAMPSWAWRWHAEIDRFPSAVLACRHPNSINLGNVAADDFCERAGRIARPDVLVFGSPCQAFSIAGKRLGLDDSRGNLALVALGIVARLTPRWFVFENVPGLLSSAGGRDFGLFLRTVDDVGYHVAWSVLDAQHFGVAQRRRRVFVVGHVRDWRGPAAVLLEPESVRWHSPPCRKAGQAIAGSLGAGSTRSGGRVSNRGAAANQVVPMAFNHQSGGDCRGLELAPVTMALQREQTPAVIANSVTCDARHAHPENGMGNIVAVAYGGNNTSGKIDVAAALNAHGGPQGRLDFESETFITHSLRADGFDASEDGTGRGTPLVSASSVVRRLTPRECERLQGFPDDYTAIVYRGKPARDGPRYKAIGNSMAVPVMRWILSRIERVDQMIESAAT